LKNNTATVQPKILICIIICTNHCKQQKLYISIVPNMFSFRMALFIFHHNHNFNLHCQTAYLKENTALTEDQILSLMEPHFDALYASGYRFLGTTSETVRYAVSGMQERIKAGII